VGKAEALDPATSAVRVSTGWVITCDVVAIAMGSSFKGDMPFNNLQSTEETRTKLHAWASAVAAAKSIIVAGGGATGVEMAGELGQEYALSGAKEVTLIIDKDLPLASKFKTDMRETAKRELEKLNVKIIPMSKVTNVTGSGGKEGKTVELTMADGTRDTVQADLFIPTFGIKPNTSFMPAELLGNGGFINQTAYLRADGQQNIFVVGDAGNLQEPLGKTADDQVLHLAKNLQAYLTGGVEEEYKPLNKPLIAVTIGRKKGTGQLGNWKVWGLIIWWFKASSLGTCHAADFTAGLRTLQGYW
jgi:NADH dehydrogenase FAD-containing subunit